MPRTVAKLIDETITTPEVAKILGYKNLSSVARLVYEHKLVPARQLPGKNGPYLFHVSDVEALRSVRAKAKAAS